MASWVISNLLGRRYLVTSKLNFSFQGFKFIIKIIEEIMKIKAIIYKFILPKFLAYWFDISKAPLCKTILLGSTKPSFSSPNDAEAQTLSICKSRDAV